MKCFGVVLLTLLYSTLARELPSSFSICKRNDPKLNECFSRSAEKALKILKEPLPEFGIPAVNPVKVEKIEVPASSSDNFRLRQKITNLEIHNLINSKVSHCDINFGEKDFNATINLENPLIELKGNYELDGKILVLQIQGEGTFQIILEKISGVLRMSGLIIEKKGKKYLQVEKTFCKVTPMLAKIKFNNLFNGDQALGESVNTLLNQNWKDIYEELSPTYEEVLAQFLESIAKQIFSKVPFDNLFPL